MDVYDYITLTFPEPLASYADSALHLRLKVDTLWEDVPFEFGRDSANLRRYNLYADWQPGESYEFRADSLGLPRAVRTADRCHQEGVQGEEARRVQHRLLQSHRPARQRARLRSNCSTHEMPWPAARMWSTAKPTSTTCPPASTARAWCSMPTATCGGTRATTSASCSPRPSTYYPQVVEFKANFEVLQNWNVTEKRLDQQKPLELKKQKPDETRRRTATAANTDHAPARPPLQGLRRACATLCLLAALFAALPAHAQCSAVNKAFSPGEKVDYNLYFNWKFIWIKAGTACLTTDTATYDKPPGLPLRPAGQQQQAARPLLQDARHADVLRQRPSGAPLLLQSRRGGQTLHGGRSLVQLRQRQLSREATPHLARRAHTGNGVQRHALHLRTC